MPLFINEEFQLALINEKSGINTKTMKPLLLNRSSIFNEAEVLCT